ncbi:ATP-binding protein [Streptomyces sp. NPDC054834]
MPLLVRLNTTRHRDLAQRQNFHARDEQRMQTPWPPLPTTAAPMDIEWRLPRHARSVGRARALFREQAASWELPQDVTDTAELLLSELMTNAYRHARVPAGREIWARCVVTEDRLRVTVTDANDTFPTPGAPSPDDESGRGLTLVAALADDWGAGGRECGLGKEVWFELAIATYPTLTPADAPSPSGSARGGWTAGVSSVPPTHGTRPS